MHPEVHMLWPSVSADTGLARALVDGGLVPTPVTDWAALIGAARAAQPAAVIVDAGLLPGEPVAALRALGAAAPGALIAVGGDTAAVADLRGAELYPLDEDERTAAAHVVAVAGRLHRARPVVDDPVSRRTLQLAHRVAGSDATVMITGESGVGKECYARFVHAASARGEGPFLAVNCAAIPEQMLEAILFGFEKGAYTGATEARAGKFEQAQGGTLLLDEITEMDIGLQAKILRVLQEKEVERLGGRRGIALDVRVLATSNRDLREAVTDGYVREDLYYRLNVLPLHVPALRERPGDIAPLARALLARHGGDSMRLGDCAERRLAEHDWPGNVRELENVIQRAIVLGLGTSIEASDLGFEDLQGIPARGETTWSSDAAPGDSGAPLGGRLRDTEDRLILDALRVERGCRKHAAARLGISPRTLRYKLARMRETGIAIP